MAWGKRDGKCYRPGESGCQHVAPSSRKFWPGGCRSQTGAAQGKAGRMDLSWSWPSGRGLALPPQAPEPADGEEETGHVCELRSRTHGAPTSCPLYLGRALSWGGGERGARAPLLTWMARSVTRRAMAGATSLIMAMSRAAACAQPGESPLLPSAWPAALCCPVLDSPHPPLARPPALGYPSPSPCLSPDGLHCISTAIAAAQGADPLAH